MKYDSMDRRISELETELDGLRRRKVAQLQEELSKLQSDLGGSRPGPAPKATKGWASELNSGGSTSAKPGVRGRGRGRGRGKRLGDEDVVERLTKVVAAAGSEGISARAAAEQSGVFYPRAIKAMADAFVKTGSGKWTRYTLK